MALKHWQGSIPNKPVAWHCPSCTAENTGPLERGCTSCHAGDPAYAKVAVQREAHNELVQRQQHPDGVLEGASTAFDTWYTGPESGRDTGWAAFAAGVRWARTQAAPAGNALTEGVGSTERPEAAPQGGWMLALIPPGSGALDAQDVDPRTQATVLAALAFYKDNQLGYGDIPGQLTATECSQLIAQLQEQEPPV